jgi:xanthine dehydrogenase YagS FAD-binding subunit
VGAAVQRAGVEWQRRLLAWVAKLDGNLSVTTDSALSIVEGTISSEDGHIRVIESSAVAMGGVAAKPWRNADAEEALVGRPADIETFRAAARLYMSGAEPLSQNAFKVDLGRHCVVRALSLATGGW